MSGRHGGVDSTGVGRERGLSAPFQARRTPRRRGVRAGTKISLSRVIAVTKHMMPSPVGLRQHVQPNRRTSMDGLLWILGGIGLLVIIAIAEVILRRSSQRRDWDHDL